MVKKFGIKTVFNKVIIGTIMIVFFWSAGNGVEASESNIQWEERSMKEIIGCMVKSVNRFATAFETSQQAIHAKLFPYAEEIRNSLVGFNAMKNDLNKDEEGTIDKIKDGQGLKEALDMTNDILEILHDDYSLKGAVEREGLSIDEVEKVKETLERHIKFTTQTTSLCAGGFLF